MKLYDARIHLGRDKNLNHFQFSDTASIKRTLDKYGIAKALLLSFPSSWSDFHAGNEVIFEAAGEDSRLIPCPLVIPDSGLEVGNEFEYVKGLIQRGARCAAFYPQTFGTTLDERVIGRLFQALEQHRLPTALFETDLADAASLADRYPDIPFILHGISYRVRNLIPILKSVSNLHLSIAPNFAPYRGLEVLVEHCGSDRFIFASGYPEAEPGAPIGYLLYSGLEDSDIEKIASANLERLLAGVRPGNSRHGDAPEPSPFPGELCDYVWKRQPLPWKGIVDMHGHYGRSSAFPIWGGEADDLVAEMDRVGIEKILVSHQAVMTPNVVWGNDQVLEAASRYPDRILGYATCYPVNEELGIEEIKRCVDAGMRGIKLHNSSGIPYASAAYESVWEFADARKLPVLLHTWGDIDKLEPIFEKYRNVTILLAHAGSEKPEMYVEYARRYDNLYLELCYSRAPYGLVEYFVREIGAARILWGSDAPWMAFGQQIGRVIFADIPEEDKKLILVENPRNILERQ